jgi:hypothetical protein
MLQILPLDKLKIPLENINDVLQLCLSILFYYLMHLIV